MCWTGKNDKRIAEEDIPCFKIVCNGFKCVHAVYRNTTYEIGKTYTLTKTIPFGILDGTTYGKIEFGFHSYHPSVVFVKKDDKYGGILSIRNERMRELDYFPLKLYGNSLLRVDCVIPKGSEYYLNDRGEYVSNQIKIVEITKKY